MSGDFECSDQYTPTIDDNLTKGKAIKAVYWYIPPGTQGVKSWCLSCSASEGITGLPSGNIHLAYIGAFINEGDR